MATFKDGNGKEWSIKMTVGLAEDLRDEVGFDFVSALFDPQKAYTIIGELYQELPKFFDVLAFACEIPEEDRRPFLRGMGGEEVANAFEALDQAFTDFYPSPKREQVAEMKAEMAKATADQADAIMKELKGIIPGKVAEILRNSMSGS